MRTHSLSPSSDYSLLSSLDVLSISASSPSSSSHPSGDEPRSARTRVSVSSQESSYEIILVPTSQRNSLSLDSSSSSSRPTVPASEGSSTTSTGISGKSKAASRRARQRNMRAKQGEPAWDPSKGAGKEPRTQSLQDYLVPPLPPARLGEEKGSEKTKKTRRGGKKNRIRLDKAQVRDALVVEDEDEEERALQAVLGVTGDNASEYSEDGASLFLDEGLLDDEDEVDGLSVLDGGEISRSRMRTPIASPRRALGSELSVEEARSSIDRCVLREGCPHRHG